jgi:hypothetical protein
MENVTYKVTGKTLTITVDLSKRLRKSGSGKTTVIATTGGNILVDPETGATMGVNIYTKQD